MKKILLIPLLLAAVFSMAACGGGSDEPFTPEPPEQPEIPGGGDHSDDNPDTPASGGNGRYLVLFASPSGNTERVAQVIRTTLDCDMLEVEPQTPYDNDYNAILERSQEELAAIRQGNYPPVKTAAMESFGDYDIVFVGYPIWCGSMATPMQTFLHSHASKLAGKRIALFATSGSSGISTSVSEARSLCPDATIIDQTLLLTSSTLSQMAAQVPTRYPDIRFVVPHCGSFLPLAIPRMKAILPAMLAKGYMQPVDWEANLANLYYHLAGGATPEVVKFLLTITTPDHLLYGSDYPYQPAEVLTENLRRMRSWIAEDEELAPYSEDIMADNAIALFSDQTNRPNNLKRNNRGPAGTCAKEPMQSDGIVRLSKIEVYPEHLEEYMKYAAEVGATSLRTEPGVLTMYAVGEKENPCQITILGTYASRAAYEKHITSEHFQKYKQGTLHMVKSLVLSDQTPLNPANRINNYIQ